MKTMTWAIAAAALVVTAGTGVLVGLAVATGAPTVAPLTWTGTVTDKDGKPYVTAVDVQLAFYDKAEAGNLKCTVPATKAEAGTGRFEVVLPGDCVAAVRETADLWSQATLGAGATLQVMPRTHVGAVPYALEADSAKVAAAASGGLKASVDGLQAAVDALKATVGSGGPWVADGGGVKLGKLLGAADVPYFGMAVQFVTSKYYFVSTTPGTFNMGRVYYDQVDCTGTAFARPSGDDLWNRVLFAGKAGVLLVPVGSPDGVSKAVTATYKSFYMPWDGTCENNPSTKQMVQLKPVTSAEVGLPASVAFPLIVQP